MARTQVPADHGASARHLATGQTVANPVALRNEDRGPPERGPQRIGEAGDPGDEQEPVKGDLSTHSGSHARPSQDRPARQQSDLSSGERRAAVASERAAAAGEPMGLRLPHVLVRQVGREQGALANRVSKRVQVRRRDRGRRRQRHAENPSLLGLHAAVFGVRYAHATVSVVELGPPRVRVQRQSPAVLDMGHADSQGTALESRSSLSRRFCRTSSRTRMGTK